MERKNKRKINKSKNKFIVHNSDRLLYEQFFIILTLQKTMVIGLTKKLVALYIARNLALN